MANTISIITATPAEYGAWYRTEDFRITSGSTGNQVDFNFKIWSGQDLQSPFKV